MSATIIFVHGRSWKPPEPSLRQLWYDAVQHGLQRDHPAGVVAKWKAARKEFVYYGDVSNRFLVSCRYQGLDQVPDDTASRRATLEALKEIPGSGFTRHAYNRLPGKSALKEAVADLFGTILPVIRLGDDLVEAVAPDMREYWSDETAFGTHVRFPMIQPLQAAMKRGDRICIVAHSLGTLIAYDTLWKASHYGEWRPFWEDKVELFVTLGSPLGDSTVQPNLKGWRNKDERKFPTNIERWLNLAAEDDYISHDSKIRGDFRAMTRLGLCDEIRDRKIYNLSVRDGKSNPHHISGYLLHPEFSAALASWL